MKSNMVENNVETDKNKQEAEEKVFPTSDRLVFTTHDNVTITLNASDMAYIHQYYTEQLTADYLRENNPDWSEDKVQTIAIETRNQMKKYDYEESYAINEAIAWYEEYESAEEEILVSIYEQIESKSVLDMDGFSTDYTMYRNTYSGEYVFIFGDKDIYTPENSDFDWTCDTEEEAWDWFHSYHGFEESIEQEIKRTVEDTTVDNSKKEVDNDITASPELQTRIDEMAIRLTNLYKELKWYDYKDKIDVDEDEVIEEMKLLLSKGDVEGIIDNLWAYNDEKYSTLHKKLKEVSELEEMTLVRVGAEQMHRVNEYIAGNIDAYTLQKELSTAGFQLAFLYKQEKDSLESSAEYKAKEIFKDLVSLKKDVFMEKYKSMEVDALFSNNQYLSIYQLKDIPENEGYYFMPSDYFIKNAKPVDINCYELIYTEETNQAMDNDAIFHRFNREHQEGYVGHALSVGDIIVQNNGTELNVSFVDSFGFEKVEDFVNEYAVETPERYILIEKENGEVFSTEYSKETYEKSTMTLHNEVDIKDVIHSLKKEKEIRPYDVNKLKEQIKQAEIKQKQQNYINNQSKRKPKL